MIRSSDPVLLLGGGPLSSSVLKDLRHLRVVAADAGADHALELGLDPIAVIGDLDSLSKMARAAFSEKLCHIADQTENDFQKALGMVEAPLILAAGFLGGRQDQTLASLSLLKAVKTPVILLGDVDVSICIRDEITLRLSKGTTIGVIPWPQARCRSEGLVWPLDDLCLSLGACVSSSNKTAAEAFSLKLLEGEVLLTLERKHLPALFDYFGFTLPSKTR